MRIARALLFVAIAGGLAHADDAKPADTHDAAKPAETRSKVPLRIVRMLPETRQALLFDKTKGTHVVVEAGQAVEGFVVDTIDEDEITLLSDSGALVVLAAPEPAWRRHRADDGHPTEGGDGREWRDAPRTAAAATAPTRAPAPAAKPGEPQPADPYSDAYADDVAPGSIGTGADGVRVVEAPDAAAATAAPSGALATIGTGADGVRVVEAPGAPSAAPTASPTPAPNVATAPAASGPAPVAVPAPAAVSSTATVRPATPGSKPASAPSTGDALAAALTGTAPATAAPAPATAAPAPVADGAVTVARADVSTALSNFTTLANGVHGAFTPTGVRIDGLAAGSLFAKAGLRAGDVVTSVDNVPLRSLDDAANLYARAATARNVTVSLVRAGKPMTLRVAIQ